MRNRGLAKRLVQMRLATIAEDGWTLLSAEDRAKEAPTRFPIPSRSVRESLKRGDCVKLLFDMEVRKDGRVLYRGVERKQVTVKEIKLGFFVGALMGTPLARHPTLRQDCRVVFKPEHVAEICVGFADMLQMMRGLLQKRMGDI